MAKPFRSSPSTLTVKIFSKHACSSLEKHNRSIPERSPSDAITSNTTALTAFITGKLGRLVLSNGGLRSGRVQRRGQRGRAVVVSLVHTPVAAHAPVRGAALRSRRPMPYVPRYGLRLRNVTVRSVVH